MNLTNWIIGLVAVVGLVLGGFGFIAYERPIPQPPVGAIAGNDFYNQINEHAGEVNSTILATSSQGSAITLTAAQLTQWANASLVSYSPGLSAETITLPASSTIRALVPNAGDRQSFCVQNATSTAATAITFAGGIGTKLLVASSTLTTTSGVKILMTGKIGCFTFTREAATSTAFDIDALLTVYQ